jgi:o-succinylbenzoate---CoA ligase
MPAAVPNNLWDHLRSFGDAPAMFAERAVFSWNELLDTALLDAAALQNHGLRPNDLCAFRGEPTEEAVRLLHALWMLGATPVPLGSRLPLNAMLKQLQQIGCRYFINLNSETIAAKDIVVISAARLQNVSDKPDEFNQYDAERPATILFTSGSSGAAKACVHTFSQHLHSAAGANLNMPLEQGGRWLLSLPLYHVAGIGIIFRAMSAGAAIALMPAGSLSAAVASLQISHLSLVSTQLHRLLEDYDAIKHLRRLKAILLGGSATPETLIRRAHELGLPIFTSYGSTEMASQITTTRPNESLEHLLSSGRILPFRELKISGDGEILVRGETLFSGYLQDGRIVRPLTNGWFAPGDMGRLDDEYYLHVEGRKDNMFISGGENIHPEEIEKLLQRIEGVEQAVVVPFEDREFGQRSAVFLKTAAGITTTDIDLSRLRADLPGFKIPARVYIWPDQVDSSSIKTDRIQFKKLAQKLVDQERDSTRKGSSAR